VPKKDAYFHHIAKHDKHKHDKEKEKNNKEKEKNDKEKEKHDKEKEKHDSNFKRNDRIINDLVEHSKTQTDAPTPVRSERAASSEPAVSFTTPTAAMPAWVSSTPSPGAACADTDSPPTLVVSSSGLRLAAHKKRRKKGGTYDFPGAGKKKMKKSRHSGGEGGGDTEDSNQSGGGGENSDKMASKFVGVDSPHRQRTMLELLGSFHKCSASSPPLQAASASELLLKTSDRKTVSQMLKEQRGFGERKEADRRMVSQILKEKRSPDAKASVNVSPVKQRVLKYFVSSTVMTRFCSIMGWCLPSCTCTSVVSVALWL
jgi:hypothetical protein